MKIRSEHLDALLQQEQTRRKQPADAGGFDELLSQQLGEAGEAQEGLPAVPPPGARAGGVSPLLLQGVEATAATSAVEEADASSVASAADSIGGLLDGWGAYAEELGKSGSGGLRNAYAMLEGLDGQLRSLREQSPDLASRHPGLASLVNDLEVMTTTEKFKFNRGDYAS